MIFVFILFLMLGVVLIIDGVNNKDVTAVNNGIIVTLIMLTVNYLHIII